MVVAPFWSRLARCGREPAWRERTKSSEDAMISAGYNGWADAPEEEREGAEPFERDGETTGKTPVARIEHPALPAATPLPAPRPRRDDRAA